MAPKYGTTVALDGQTNLRDVLCCTKLRPRLCNRICSSSCVLLQCCRTRG